MSTENSELEGKSIVEETKVTTPVVETKQEETKEAPVAGFLSEDEDDDKSYNRILPRALNGKGIPVVLSKLPTLVEVGKDANKFLAINWEFYKADEDAYSKQNVAIPMESVDCITEQDTDRQKRAERQLKHLLGAFIDYTGIPATGYRDFIEKALTRFTPAMVGTKAEIKLVYSANNKYVQFPLYPNFISTAKKKKTLETDPNSSYDKIVKTKNAASGAMSSSDDTDPEKYNDMV